MQNTDWTSKGAALSDKTAREIYGLTQDQIIEAIKRGELQYRQNVMHGNPYFRLLRCEVEALAQTLYGRDQLERKLLEAELQSVDREIRQLKTKQKRLEKRKSELVDLLEKLD
jgi:hypothetical protein